MHEGRGTSMTKADRKALMEYVRWIADHMGLRDWRFSILHDPCESSALAICTPTEGQRMAALEFAADFRELDPDVQRMTVVHELLHCHHAHTQDIARLHTTQFMGQHAYDAFHQTYRLVHEYAVDAVARAWAEDLPRIDWPKPKPKRGKASAK